MEAGRVNPTQTLDQTGITGVATAHYNLRESALIEAAIKNGEGELGQGGTILVSTGKYTGRSPQDKFVVDEPSVKDTIWWENNPPMAQDAFAQLHADMLAHMGGKEYYVQDLFGGADPDYRVNVRLVTELAWHSLFIRTMLRRPEPEELDSYIPEYTVINCPTFKADPAKHGCRTDTVIAISIEKKLILIGGTEYAGENKKSVFSLLNYLLPDQGVMPMHCSANHAKDDTDDVAVFFGLSGTGKTTLSADPNRILIGDDEHGWSNNGTFNFEGGCYAKLINLSEEAEPEIYATTRKYGTVLENVVMDPDTRELDLDDNSLAENTRGAYPLNFIPNTSEHNRGGKPKNIIMLTADAFGVLPPISRLTPEQAMYHFLSGYTAKVAGTEIGVKEPQATFSTCFGAPFMPRHPSVYGDLLRKKIAETGVNCWLVNTGWTGGVYGVGNRMPIKDTRALLHAALDGSLNTVPMRIDPNFGFEVPVEVPGVDSLILNPRDTWEDKQAYDDKARYLVELFINNFEAFSSHVDDSVNAAAPSAA